MVYLDDDVVVRGDIKELAATSLGEHPIAVSSDCSWVSQKYKLFENKYGFFLNFDNPTVRGLGMDPEACGFNAGVFVADLRRWRELHITDDLVKWLTLNTQEDVYGSGKGGGGSQPPMMITFYNRRSELDPLWHIRSLGSRWGYLLPKDMVYDEAKLLHWTGRAKPWLPDANPSFTALFREYEVTIPTQL